MVAAAFVVAGVLIPTGRAEAASDPDPTPAAEEHLDPEAGLARVHVRVYDAADMSATSHIETLRAATEILTAAGIDIQWLVCTRGDAPANPPDCGSPLTRDELVVRLVRVPGTPSARGSLSLGYALIDTPSASGTVATVYVDRVEWLVSGQQGHDDATVRWCDGATVLGFAVAHEVGHLLMGTTAHGQTGLMRAVWSRTDLLRGDPEDWRFTAADGRAMTRGLRQRRDQRVWNR